MSYRFHNNNRQWKSEQINLQCLAGFKEEWKMSEADNEECVD